MTLPARRLRFPHPWHVVALALVPALALAACAEEPSPTPGPLSTPPSPSATATTEPSPSAADVSVAPSAAPSASARTIADEPGPLALEVVADGLASPIGFATVPDGTLLVHERGGRVVQLDPATGEQSVFLDLSDRVLAGGEQGLLGLVLDPEWPEVARAVVHYTDPAGDTVV